MKRFKQYDFTQKIADRELRCFLFPFFLSAGFQCIYAMVNTAVVSRYLSQEAVAVIGACTGCVSIINSMLPAFISGFGIYISRCIGSGDSEEIRQDFWGAVYITLAIGAICAALTVFSKGILQQANVPKPLMADAIAYFRIILLGAGILYLKLILISTIQGMGNSTIPALISMAGVVVQTLLVIFLIVVLHMGIASSSLAILLNNLWQVLVLILFLRNLSGDKFLFTLPSRIRKDRYLAILTNGCSKGFMFVLLSIGSFIMQHMENNLSTDMLAGDAYSDQFTSLFTELLSAYGTAAVVIVGQNAKRGNYRLIHDYIERLSRRSLPWYPLIGMISLVFAPVLIGSLAGNGASSEAIRAGILEMRIIFISYPFLTALVILRYTLQSMGDYLAMPIFGFVEMIINISMAMLIPLIGYPAVCLGLALSRIGAGVTAILRYRGFMKKRCP
ncbi:MAG: MATE family efflux transporter [Oliverpabstia sp.]|nr:MATE family efflux transporter [Lachnospiraceae bacterium]MDY5026128.1 MATE family efflux transporter [Oliverpabstia sp.]